MALLFVCKTHYFSRFSVKKVGCVLYKRTINIFWLHSGWDDKKVISIVQINVFYAGTEKYPLECVFIYNSISPNVWFLHEHVRVFTLNTV